MNLIEDRLEEFRIEVGPPGRIGLSEDMMLQLKKELEEFSNMKGSEILEFLGVPVFNKRWGAWGDGIEILGKFNDWEW